MLPEQEQRHVYDDQELEDEEEEVEDEELEDDYEEIDDEELDEENYGDEDDEDWESFDDLPVCKIRTFNYFVLSQFW